MSGHDSDFDWSEQQQVQVPEQRATAVYTNVNGELVIRQEAGTYDDQDSVVVVSKRFAHDLIDAIQGELS